MITSDIAEWAVDLMADLQLRPVLTELGASTPTPGVALTEADLDDLPISAGSPSTPA